MDTVFEITTIQTKSILKQVGARVMRDKLILHFLLLMAISIVFGLFVVLRQIQAAYSFALVFCMACVGLSIYRFFSVPEKYAEQAYTEMVNIHREPVKNKICVYSRRITVENLLLHTVHSYDPEDCSELLEAPGIFLIKTKKNSYIILDKAGFSKGSPDEFSSFFADLTAQEQISEQAF